MDGWIDEAPQDRAPEPGAFREGPQRWRAVIHGIKDGASVVVWRSEHTYPTCATAKRAATARWSRPEHEQ